MVLYYLKKNFSSLGLELKDFKPQLNYIADIASLGIAPAFNQLSLLIVQLVMNNSAAYYGGQSRFGAEIPLAVIGIGFKVNMIFFSCALGISQGMQPIVSYNYGAKKYPRIKEAYSLSIKSSVAILFIAFLLFQLIPSKLLALFGSGSPEYFEFGVYFFRIFFMLTFVVPFQPITTNLMTSIGKSKKGMLVALSRQIILFIPLALILPKYFGIMGLLAAGPIADGLSFVFTLFMARAVFKNLELEAEQY